MCHMSCVMCHASSNLMYVCLFVSVWLAVCVSGCLSVYPLVRPFVRLFVCLCLRLCAYKPSIHYPRNKLANGYPLVN